MLAPCCLWSLHHTHLIHARARERRNTVVRRSLCLHINRKVCLGRLVHARAGQVLTLNQKVLPRGPPTLFHWPRLIMINLLPDTSKGAWWRKALQAKLSNIVMIYSDHSGTGTSEQATVQVIRAVPREHAPAIIYIACDALPHAQAALAAWPDGDEQPFMCSETYSTKCRWTPPEIRKTALQ